MLKNQGEMVIRNIKKMSDLDPETQTVIHNVLLLNICIDIPFLQKQTSTKTGL